MAPELPLDIVHVILNLFTFENGQRYSTTCPYANDAPFVAITDPNDPFQHFLATRPKCSVNCPTCSPSTIRACSRVCKLWAPICQRRLFHSLYHHDVGYIDALGALIRASPHLADYIADIELGDPRRSLPMYPILTLPPLPAVRRVLWSVRMLFFDRQYRRMTAHLRTALPNVTALRIGGACDFDAPAAIFHLPHAFARLASLIVDHIDTDFTFDARNLDAYAAEESTSCGPPLALRALVVKDHLEPSGVDLSALYCAYQRAGAFSDADALQSLHLGWLKQPLYMRYVNELFHHTGRTLTTLKLTLPADAMFPDFDLSQSIALETLEVELDDSPFRADLLKRPLALANALPAASPATMTLCIKLDHEGKEALGVAERWDDILKLFSSAPLKRPCTLMVAVNGYLETPTCALNALQTLREVGVTLRIG